MNWEKVGKAAYQFGLLVIEWGLKICAFVASSLALAGQGSLGMKIGAGFGSLSAGLRSLFEAPESFQEISWAVREYNQLGRAEFHELYGSVPIDQVMASFNNFFIFGRQVSANMMQQPLVSIVAALLVFSFFYLLARVIQFARQRGRRSWLCRFEQRLGDRVFNRQDVPSTRRNGSEKIRSPSSVEQTIRKSSPKLT